jgi:Lhr-like helicase
MTMLKHDKMFRAASASNKQQSTAQLLTLWREAATECSSGTSKSAMEDILDVAEVVKIEK